MTVMVCTRYPCCKHIVDGWQIDLASPRSIRDERCNSVGIDRQFHVIGSQPQLSEHMASTFVFRLGHTVELGPRAGGRGTRRPAIRGRAHKRGGELAVKSVNSHGTRNTMRNVDEP